MSDVVQTLFTIAGALKRRGYDKWPSLDVQEGIETTLGVHSSVQGCCIGLQFIANHRPSYGNILYATLNLFVLCRYMAWKYVRRNSLQCLRDCHAGRSVARRGIQMIGMPHCHLKDTNLTRSIPARYLIDYCICQASYIDLDS